MKMSEADLDACCERANQVWQDYQTPELNAKTWGLFSYGDAPAGIGGGVGCFIWLATKQEMLQFAAKVLPYSPPGPLGSDVCAVANEVNLIIDQLLDDQLDLEVGRETLNRTLRNFSQIEWWGTFADLCEGSHPYAKNVIQYFRASFDDAGPGASPSIRTHELERFKEFLEDFGA